MAKRNEPNNLSPTHTHGYPQADCAKCSKPQIADCDYCFQTLMTFIDSDGLRFCSVRCCESLTAESV